MATQIRKSMIEQTKTLIRNDSRSIAQLAEETDISKEWLYKFIAGEIKEPGFNRIVDLHAFLKKKRKKKAA